MLYKLPNRKGILVCNLHSIKLKINKNINLQNMDWIFLT